MGCRDQLKKVILISCCLSGLFLTSCNQKQDVLLTQTEDWLKTEFGEKAVIQSLSLVPTEQPENKFWRVSIINENGNRWEGLVMYTVSLKKFTQYEIPLPSQEEK